jgi:hypothetical protein
MAALRSGSPPRTMRQPTHLCEHCWTPVTVFVAEEKQRVFTKTSVEACVR